MRHYKLRFKETEVAQSFERYCGMFTFLTLFVVDVFDLPSPFIVIHMYSPSVSGAGIW